MVSIYLTAFATNPFSILSFPPSIPDTEMTRWLTSRFSSMFAKREIKAFKMTHVPTGQLAAFIRWTWPTILTPAEKEDRKREKAFRDAEKKEGRDPVWPVGANLQLCDEKFGQLYAKREQFMGEEGKEEWYVAELLATSPEFQRRGLGSLLLSHGLELADREGRRCYIEATPAGWPVYLKLGFRDVGIVEVDLKRYGMDLVGNNRCMVREPVRKGE